MVQSLDKYYFFIQINNNEDEYYHIYFDNSKEETKRNHLEKNEKIKKYSEFIIQLIYKYKLNNLIYYI